MPVDFKQFHQNGIDGDPKVEKDQASRIDTHKLIVVRDLLVELEAKHDTWEEEDDDEDPTAGTGIAKDWKSCYDWAVNNEGNFKTAFLTSQAIFLDWLGLIVEACNDHAYSEEQDEEEHAEDYIENMDSCIALKSLIDVVIPVLTIKHRDKCFIERQIKNPY